jgi:hypothetical protein
MDQIDVEHFKFHNGLDNSNTSEEDQPKIPVGHPTFQKSCQLKLLSPPHKQVVYPKEDEKTRMPNTPTHQQKNRIYRDSVSITTNFHLL